MYLFDTHALLWALSDDPRLGSGARAVFSDEQACVFVSTASVWEMAIKSSLGKLELAQPLARLVAVELPNQGIRTLGLEDRHVLAVEALPFRHRDPFDRLLAATALVESFTVVSRDEVFDAYGLRRVW